MAFDTLGYAKRLRDAGVSQEWSGPGAVDG